MRIQLISLAMVGTLAALGCGLEDEGPMPYTPPAGSGIQQDPNKTNAQPNGNTNQNVQAPAVDPLPLSACTASIPLTGKGPMGTAILVKGGQEPISTDSHSVTGRFCVDVKLFANSVNTLKVYTLDPDHGLSKPTLVSVRQAKCNSNTPAPQPIQKSKNQAVGAKVTSSQDPDTGKVSSITDGDTTTSARFSGGWAGFGAEIWVMVDLGKLVEVDRVVLSWLHSSSSADKYFATDYTLMVAGGGTPGIPATGNAMWTQVADINSGIGGTNSHKLSNNLVRYVAVIMDRDGVDWTWTETFDLAEIQVWDVPQKSSSQVVNPAVKTCSNIGVGD